ncbi:MAG: hypothetical protein JJU11_18640 [Candidatus Sumerlaeia bacterium]|nr:hypothetical protein [Candidatus Sumerlaeia bacterium]
MINWHFNTQSPTGVHRAASADDYFSTTMENPAEPLVREGAQNSLDAKSDGPNHQPVRIKITLSGSRSAAKPEDVSPFFNENFWRHIQGDRNGLYNPPGPGDKCPYLVFEDFGTTGLTGNEDEFKLGTIKNPFFYFFRAEGLSDKEIKERGRWGMGKSVFRLCSRVRSWFGYTTRRSDGKTLLMGRTVLAPRTLDGADYTPDGYFGKSLDPNTPILPIGEENKELLTSFNQVFSLSRSGGQFGTSVVVPWYKDDEIDFAGLRGYAVKHYFLPIIRNRLFFELEELGGEMAKIDRAFIEDWVEGVQVDSQEDERIKAAVRLALWAESKETPTHELELDGGDHFYDWSGVDNENELWRNAKEKHENCEPLFFRIPIKITAKKPDRSKGMTRESFFDVLLQKNIGLGDNKPLFIRNDLLIPEVRSKSPRDVVALVVIQDETLAEVLGKAENPAHTEWVLNSSQSNASGLKFKDCYLHAPGILRQVQDAHAQIIDLLFVNRVEEDPSLLLDFFSIDREEDSKTKKRRKSRKEEKPGGDESQEPPDIPAARPKRYRIHQQEGGFAVTSGDLGSALLSRIKVSAAYAVRRGDPFKAFTKDVKNRIYDFDFRKPAIDVSLDAVEEIGRDANELRLKVLEESFRVEVTGFDPNRDLKVKVDVWEADDDS